MKNFILIFIFIVWVYYYFVPNETKLEIYEKLWIQKELFIKEEKVVDEKKSGVVELKFDKFRISKYEWNLSDWKVLNNLNWASLWYVKCFYKNDYPKFTGNMVIHRISVTKWKNLSIKLTKENESLPINIYAYKTSIDSDVFPPDIAYVYDCKTDITNNLEKTIEITRNTAPYDVVIWVTWSWNLLEWWYKLELQEK